METTLIMNEQRIKTKQYKILRSSLITVAPIITAKDCPNIASHLRFVSVLRNTKSLLFISIKLSSIRLEIIPWAEYIPKGTVIKHITHSHKINCSIQDINL